ncbi:homeodomain-like superfamily protein [Tanacetum coccineum]|uniref:Homeodomain-like superfamily protein n=1 Tax=Tanacetum coccineum TaxID=301880 RepID=A0ABQ5EKV7_9ASTR
MVLTESFWVPLISENVLSVIDVAPLSLVESYLEFWMLSRLAIVEKECLFPFKGIYSTTEDSGFSSDPTHDKARNNKSKKRIAAAFGERSKKQSIAIVPKPTASLALRFFPIFNLALFPYKPPGICVANRVLFTDSSDDG